MRIPCFLLTCLVTLALACPLRAGTAFDIRNHAEFGKIVETNHTPLVLAEGFGWVEGPVWVPRDGGYLIFSDMGNNRMHRWSKAEGLTVFRSPCNRANGNTIDLSQRLITCETDARRVVLTERDGTLKTLVDKYDGTNFNAPNDVVVQSDGTIWFTDPNYGLGQTQAGRYVFRFSPGDGNKTVTAVAKDFVQPNGLCFSPDEQKLYIADSDATKHHIRVFDVTPEKTLANGRVFCTIDNGVPDGIRCDIEGRIYSSARDGVHVYLPDGQLIGKILIPNTVANVAFGDADWSTLYIVAQPKLYSLRLKVASAVSRLK
jgi:gluconolactonase